MKTNFHTHHHLCGHAGGNCEDYVLEALEKGFTELGFSDHAPNDTYKFGYRMHDSDFKDYLKDIKYVKKKYKNRLTIKRGIEIEYLYNESEYYQRFLQNLDYFILGQHFISMKKDNKNMISSFALTTKEEITMYAEHLCDAMETGLFAIIAHPDLYMCGYLDFDQHAASVAHKIAKCAEKTDTILEFNGNGYRRPKGNTPQGILQPYPRIEFWEIVKQYNVRTILSSDCHSPKQLYDDTIKKAEVEYQKLNLKQVQFFREFESK